MSNNILLVYGGNSVEHEISVITALQVKNKYKGKYNLILCYLKDSKFYISKKLEDISFYKDLKENLKKLKSVAFVPNQNVAKIKRKNINFEAVWLVVHGSNCEDGTLYSYFKTLNIDVIGENLASAIIGQNKSLTKKCCGVNTLPYTEITYNDFCFNLESIINKTNELGYPLIIKPVDLGSSVGISSINNNEELIDKLEQLFYLSKSVLIEKKLDSFVELNIAAFHYKNNLLLSNIEKVSNNQILSYDDKYVNDKKSMAGQNKELPAIIDDKTKNEMEEMAKSIYYNLKAQYIVRMDFLYDTNENKLYFNEINNIPGSLSLYLFDIESSILIDMYIDEGLKNVNNEKNIITNYENNIFKHTNFNNVKFNK